MGCQTIRRVDSFTVRKTLGLPPIELVLHWIVGMKREEILEGAATRQKKKRVRTSRIYVPKTFEKKTGMVITFETRYASMTNSYVHERTRLVSNENFFTTRKLVFQKIPTKSAGNRIPISHLPWFKSVSRSKPVVVQS